MIPKGIGAPSTFPGESSGSYLELVRHINNIFRRCRTGDDGGFRYLCLRCQSHFTGRKPALAHLTEEHSSLMDKLSELYCDEAELRSLIVKSVMVVPYMEKRATVVSSVSGGKQLKENRPGPEEKGTNTCGKETKKLLPLTLEMMRVVDARKSGQEGTGGIHGRVARLLSMIVNEGEEKGTVNCSRCNIQNMKASLIESHLKKSHANFLSNLLTLLPQAKKRFSTHLQRALQDFKIQGPEKIVRISPIPGGKQDPPVKKTIRPPPPPPPLPNPNKRKSSEPDHGHKKRQPVPPPPSYQYIFPLKVFDHPTRFRQQQLRESQLLSQLSPGQLRKLTMHYNTCLAAGRQLDFGQLLQSVKLSSDAVVGASPPLLFLTDFLQLLYEKARGYYETPQNTTESELPCRPVKIGHVLINTMQCKAILRQGLRSVRVGMGKATLLSQWRYPEDWQVDPPSGLGSCWGRDEDSRLLLAAHLHNGSFNRVVEDFKEMGFTEPVARSAQFRERYGYMVNLFTFRGKYNKEIGNSLADLTLPEEPPATVRKRCSPGKTSLKPAACQSRGGPPELLDLTNDSEDEAEDNLSSHEAGVNLEADSALSTASERVMSLEEEIFRQAMAANSRRPVKRKVAHGKKEAKRETEMEVEAEMKVEAEVETETKVDTESKAETIPEVVTESKVDAVTEVNVEPEVETEVRAVTEVETDTEVGTEVQADTEVETEVRADTEVGKEVQTVTEVETDTEVGTEVQADTEVETEVQADTEVETEVQADTEAETEVLADTEAETETKVETVTDGVDLNPRLETDKMSNSEPEVAEDGETGRTAGLDSTLEAGEKPEV